MYYVLRTPFVRRDQISLINWGGVGWLRDQRSLIKWGGAMLPELQKPDGRSKTPLGQKTKLIVSLRLHIQLR